jgi:hypothetical protein
MTLDSISVAAVMSREWFVPFEESMKSLGVAASLVGERLDSDVEVSFLEHHGVVIQLSHEVVGRHDVDPQAAIVPLAGLPTGSESESLAKSLGISEILSGEEQAREWVQTLARVSSALTPPLIAIWGTAGAPGATSLAIDLAHELARTHSTLLVDADFCAPSIEQLLEISGDDSGLLGALRIARNPQPPWGSVSGHLLSAEHASFNILTGVKPGSLSLMEAGVFSTLLETARAAGVAMLVEVKCSLTLGQTPEKVAADSVLDEADRAFFVGWATNLGVSRLVRDMEEIRLGNVVERTTVALRVPVGQPKQAFDRASEAIWTLTGHTDFRRIPESVDLQRSSISADLLRDVSGFAVTSTPTRTSSAGKQLRLIDRLLTQLGRKPLP